MALSELVGADITPIGSRAVEIAEVTEAIEREERYRSSIRRYHKAMDIEYDFHWKLKQHSERERRELERRDRLKVVSLDLYSTIRYASSEVGGSSIYLDVRALSPGETDAEQADLSDIAEITRQVMESLVHDIDIGYPRVRRRVVRRALSARAGAVRLDIVTGGPFGPEVIPTQIPPSSLAWDAENYIHFNDPGCPELWETLTVDLKWAKNNPDFSEQARQMLKADDGRKLIEVPRTEPKVDKQAAARGRDKITLKVGWIKQDDEEVEVIDEDEPEELPADQHHMVCPTCGYTEKDLSTRQDYDGSGNPDTAPCPQCGENDEGDPAGYMHKIMHAPKIGAMPAYPDKKRRVVIAPFCPNAGYLKEGSWPKNLTSYPYMLHLSDPFPDEPFGNSYTFLNMDLQSMKNSSLRSGFEQMDRNRDLLVALSDALVDSNNEAYQFDGSGDYVAYVHDIENLKAMRQFQGSGLNESFGLWMNIVNDELSRFKGTSETNLSAEEMKGTPVGTVARMQETGDVPLDEVIRILREDEEQLFNRWLEMGSGCWTMAKWVEVIGKTGLRAFRLFQGNKIPRMRLRVHASPNISQVDLDSVNTIKGLIGAPPAILRFVGKTANLPQSLIEELISETTQPPAGPAPGGGPNTPPVIPGGPMPAGGPVVNQSPAGMAPVGA